MAWRIDPPIVELILHNDLLKIETELKKTEENINQLDSTSRAALHYCILPEEGTVKSKRNMGYETFIEDSDSCEFRKMKKWDQVEWLDLNNPSLKVLKTWQKRLAVAYLLCKYGADVNVTDQANGGLPLLSACAQRGDLRLIQLLIHFGADTAWKTSTDIAYNRGNVLCAAYIDKHSLSLRAQCRGTLRVNGIRQDNLAKLPLPNHVKLFLNYNLLFTGYAEKLVPIRTFTDEHINTGEVSVDEVVEFIRKYATESFCNSYSQPLTKKKKSDLVMLMHTLYSSDCFYELKYEEPLARRPRYSMEPVPEERMRKLGLYRSKEKNEKPTEKRFNIFNRK